MNRIASPHVEVKMFLLRSLVDLDNSNQSKLPLLNVNIQGFELIQVQDVGKNRHLEATKSGRRERCKRALIENGAEEPTNSKDDLQKHIFTKGVIVANSFAMDAWLAI